MAKWCSVTITFAPTGYSQNYKRDIGVHDHARAQAFTTAALQDALTGINQHRPRHMPIAMQNQLGILNQKAYEPNDPGKNFRLI